MSSLRPGVAERGPFTLALQEATHATDRAVVREAATQLVSSAFIMPVLAAMRESPFVEPPFAPTFAEKQFAPLLDQQVADEITGAANFSLVDVIVERLIGPDDRPPPPPPAPERTDAS